MAGACRPQAMEPLNRITLLDNTKRPKAPKFEGVTPRQRQMGRRLRQFHNMHRQQLAEVASAMLAIDQDVAGLVKQIADLDMRSNIKNFGNLCGQECQMLSGHHSIEDAYVFPQLQHRGDDVMKKLVARLAAEHLVIHELIEELGAAAHAAWHSPTPETYTALKQCFTDLNTSVQSHFGYEETELEDALGVLGVEV
jgi:iron-sulfur cluster repair protein YtfE (RIC family)